MNACADSRDRNVPADRTANGSPTHPAFPIINDDRLTVPRRCEHAVTGYLTRWFVTYAKPAAVRCRANYRSCAGTPPRRQRPTISEPMFSVNLYTHRAPLREAVAQYARLL